MTNRPDDFDFGNEYNEYADEDTPTGSRTRPQAPLTSPGMASVRRPTDDAPTTYSRPLTAPPDAEGGGRVGRRVSSRATEPLPVPRQPAPKRPPLPPPNVPAAARRGAAPKPKHDSGLYLPWWSLLILIVFVGAAAVGAWAVVGYLGGNFAPGGGTPVVIVITSTFTVGPPATLTAIPLAPSLTAPAALPTIAPTGTIPPGTFQVGARVKVVGVGVAGLNIRSSPGTDGLVKFRALEEEEFVLREQPQFASNIEWWFVQSESDPNRSGWASRQYLEVLSAQP